MTTPIPILNISSSIIISDDNARNVLKIVEKRLSNKKDLNVFTSIARLMDIDENGFLEFKDIQDVLGLSHTYINKRLSRFMTLGILKKTPIKQYLKSQGLEGKVNHRLVCYEFIKLGKLTDEILSNLSTTSSGRKKTTAVGWLSKNNVKNDLLKRKVDDLPAKLRTHIKQSPTTTYLSYPLAMGPLIAPADDVIFAKERTIIDGVDKAVKTNVISAFGITNNFDIKTLNSLKLITLEYLEMKAQKLGYQLDLDESASIEIPVYISDLCDLHGLNQNTSSFRRAVSVSLLRVFESTYLLPRGDASQRFKFLQALTTIGDKEMTMKTPADNLGVSDVSDLNLEKVDMLIDSSYGENFPFSCVTFRWTFEFFKEHIFNNRVTKLDAQVTRLKPTIYAIFYALYNDCKIADASFSFIKSNDNVVHTTLESLIQFTWTESDESTRRHLCKKVLNDLNSMTTWSKEKVDEFTVHDDGVTYIKLNLFGFIIEFHIPNFSNKSAMVTNLSTAVKITLDLKELSKNEVDRGHLRSFLPQQRRRRRLIANDGVRNVLDSLSNFKNGRYALTWELSGNDYLISLYSSDEELNSVYASVADLIGSQESDVKIALEHYLLRLKRFNHFSNDALEKVMKITLMSKTDVIRYLTPRTRFLKKLSEMNDIEIENFFGVLD